LPLGEIALVARKVGGNRVTVVALRLAEDDIEAPPPALSRKEKATQVARRAWRALTDM